MGSYICKLVLILYESDRYLVDIHVSIDVSIIQLILPALVHSHFNRTGYSLYSFVVIMNNVCIWSYIVYWGYNNSCKQKQYVGF